VTVGSFHPGFFRTPMADETDPVVRSIFKSFEGFFAFTPIESVVDDMIRAIEQRSVHFVSPRKLSWAALAAGVLERLADRFGYSDDDVREAIAHVDERRHQTAPRGYAPQLSSTRSPLMIVVETTSWHRLQNSVVSMHAGGDPFQ
jgi:hypothetical protein